MRHLALLSLFVAASAFAQEIAVSDPSFEPQPATSARVSAIGDRFVTVWTGVNGGAFASVTNLDGTLLRGPVTLSITGGIPAIAGGSNGGLVAWLDGGALYTTTIDKDGKAGASTKIQSGLNGPVDVVWNGSRFLVVASGAAGAVGFLFDERGQQSSDALPIGQFIRTATPDDGGFLIFAQKNVDDAHPEKGATIEARRIESSGKMQPWTQTTTEVSYPRIAAIGRTLFWEYGGVLHRVITDALGAPLSNSVIANGTLELQRAVETASGPLLLFAGTPLKFSLMLVGRDRRLVAEYGPSDGLMSDLAAIGTRTLLVAGAGLSLFRGYLVDATTAIHVSDPINLGRMASEQLLPQVASNGSLLLAVWLERDPTVRLFAARIDPQTGRPLDGRGILLDSHPYFTSAAVAPVGDGFVVAYLEVSSGVAHLMIRRMSADGTLDPAATLVSPTAQPWPPRLASDGHQALLVWTENTYSVHGTRMSRDGAILDPAFLAIGADDITPGEPTLTFAPDAGIDGDDDYLVAWQKNVGSGRSTRTGMSAVHVSRSGVVLNPPATFAPAYTPRVAGNAIATNLGAGVVVDFFGGGTLMLGQGTGLGDIEQLGSGFLAVVTVSHKIRAVQIEDGRVVSTFEPLPHPTPADAPTLTKTPSGVALAYVRMADDEGYGGAFRAYVLPIGEQRRRSTAN